MTVKMNWVTTVHTDSGDICVHSYGGSADVKWYTEVGGQCS